MTPKTDSPFTEDELQTLAVVMQAIMRARIKGNGVAHICAVNELNRLGRVYGKAKCEAIARELDARAPLGSLSSPAQQGSIP